MQISPELREWRRNQVATLTAAGYKASEIATRLGCTGRTVVRDRAALGISKPSADLLTSDELHRAQQLLDDGCSYREAARTIGRSSEAVRHHFPGRGWTPTQIAEYAAIMRQPRHRGPCNVVGCNNPHQAKGLCSTHYTRARRAAA